MMDLANKDLGSEGNVELKVVDGKLILEVSHIHASGKVSLLVEEDGTYFLDKLAKAIPGQVDDAIFAVIKGALKAV